MSKKESQLPVEAVEEIQSKAEHYATVEWGDKAKFVSSFEHNNWQNAAEDYEAGATEWATKLKQLEAAFKKSEAFSVEVMKDCTEAKKLLTEVFQKHESGLLPDRFVYDKIKTFLYGE